MGVEGGLGAAGAKELVGGSWAVVDGGVEDGFASRAFVGFVSRLSDSMTRILGPSFGFMTAWILFLALPFAWGTSGFGAALMSVARAGAESG